MVCVGGGWGGGGGGARGRGVGGGGGGGGGGRVVPWLELTTKDTPGQSASKPAHQPANFCMGGPQQIDHAPHHDTAACPGAS